MHPHEVLLPWQVKVEDFSSYLAKLSTPRELMIMMTEMCAAPPLCLVAPHGMLCTLYMHAHSPANMAGS